MNSFQYKPSKRIWELFGFIFWGTALFINGFQRGNLFSIEEFFIIGLPINWGIFILIFLGITVHLLVPLHILAMGLYIYTLKVRLEDKSAFFSATRIFPLNLSFAKKSHFIGELPYDEIINVKFSYKGLLKIEGLEGLKISLDVPSLEDTDLFINTLKLKIPNQKMLLDKIGTKERPRNVFSFILILLIASSFVSDTYLELKKSHIWNENFPSNTVHSISIDDDSSIWAAVEYQKRGLVIWHLQENDKRYWVLPEYVCTDYDCRTAYVGHDNSQNPAVVIQDDDNSSYKLYQLKGGQWENSVVKISFPYKDIVGFNNRIYGALDDKLLKINLQSSNTEITELEQPSQLEQLNARLDDYKVLPNGGLIVEYYDKSSKTQYIAINKDNHWKEVVKFSNSDIFIQEFTQDTNGRLWALSSENKINDRYLGVFEKNTNQWTWVKLDFDEKLKNVAYFLDFAFDSQGRLWVSGVYNQGTVSKNFDNFAWVISNDNKYRLEAVYTEENSNLSHYVDSLMPTGNTLWHQGYDLAWVDTSDTLPKPLSPYEITWLNYVLLRYFVLITVYGLGYVILSPTEKTKSAE